MTNNWLTLCISKATVILCMQEEEEGKEVEGKEMSRDVSAIDWTGACPPPFINKYNLPHAWGRCVLMTMSNAGTHPNNTCEKVLGSKTEQQEPKLQKKKTTEIYT